MKNIHVLPTEKPSRLSILNNGKLNFGAEIMSSSNSKPQHIYITSDEEIKEGDWFIHPDSSCFDKECKEVSIGGYEILKVIKVDENFIYHSAIMAIHKNMNIKKIILTTDQDLIKDGIQPIDDDFLEWFVKNPSCESVEVNFIEDNWGYYEIIIPQEEPKQETLEEAAERLFPSKMSDYEIFLLGAKWMQERMYSEEEVENILIEYIKTNPTKPYRVISWFQQFKKK